MTEPISIPIATKAARLLVRVDKESPRLGVPVSGVEVRQAVAVVHAITGLDCDETSLRVTQVDRLEWVQLNLRSYNRLLAGVPQQPISNGIREFNSAALGVVLGVLSGRVLGQYLPAFSAGPEEAGIVLVSENLTKLSATYGFDPEQFRLWVLIHEMTHRAQFVGVPWFERGVYSLIGELLGLRQPKLPELIMEVLERLVRAGSLAEVDLSTLFIPLRAKGVMDRLTTTMTVAEGHGEWVMRQVPLDTIPDRQRFEDELDRRRRQTPVMRVIAAATGLRAKQKQYSRGLAFFRGIEEFVPLSARDVFRDSDCLPTSPELVDPRRWVERVIGNRVQAPDAGSGA
ncbi:MAG: zinc-dependent metalloprotease [Ferrimicrobium sp.]